jgi:hypothetical protein
MAQRLDHNGFRARPAKFHRPVLLFAGGGLE